MSGSGLSEEELRKRNDSKKEDDSSLKGRIYNRIIDRYTKKDNLFTFSDQFIWKGSVFMVPQFVGYIVFIALMLWLADISLERYGEVKTIIFFILLLMWRIQIGVKELAKLNKKL